MHNVFIIKRALSIDFGYANLYYLGVELQIQMQHWSLRENNDQENWHRNQRVQNSKKGVYTNTLKWKQILPFFEYSRNFFFFATGRQRLTLFSLKNIFCRFCETQPFFERSLQKLSINLNDNVIFFYMLNFLNFLIVYNPFSP